MRKFSILAAMLLSTAVVSGAYATSGGIMSDRQSECAIWLCLPGGFPAGCEAAFAAYTKRITAMTGGKHPKRRFTDLPDFALCKDPNPEGIDDFNVGPESVITYQGAYEVHMPAYNTCTRWAYRNCGDNCSIRYCAAIKTTPARVFESQDPYHYYETISVGQTEYRELRAPTKHYTDVLVDGKQVGKRYYD